jgi:superfamily II DNA or RNA helicase
MSNAVMNRLFEDAPNYASSTFPEPRQFQQHAHDLLRQGFRDGHKNQMIMAPTGAGKCLGHGTPVLMADGSIVPVQDIRTGDALMGPDGKPRNVLGVSSGQEMLYRVTPKKGDAYVVNASHILSLRKTPGSDGLVLADGHRVDRDDDVVNTNVVTFARSNTTARHCLKGWRSDAISSFLRDDDEADRLVPPYILGAWLGDGTQGRAAISKPQCKMVDEWVSYGESVGYGCRNQAGEGDCPTWILTNGQDGRSFNLIQNALELIGVLHSRHVPDAYKFAPLKVRLEVLAGLIDSDGHINHGGCDWISKSEQLAIDFAFLCRSVGLACYISKQRKTIKGTDFEGWYWRASVSGDLSLVPMRDKVSTVRAQKKRQLVHGITVEPLEVGDYYGFEIDGDHLFLLGDFTVTHNTYLGHRIAHEALVKGRSVVFVCDRTTLINQTSKAADTYGLAAHGVVQANHWRRNDMPYQIASAQTLAKRGYWPKADVVIIDEAHTQLKVWTEFIMNTKAACIGLSATPFSPGLGKLFSNLINATTMHDLTQSGVLVPMRVFACKRANMAGASTAGGEWTDSAAEERGMEIIGDVVSEWVKFGENRKTIVFGATIKHCEELARQFVDAGVMAAVFTSETTAAERELLLKEYSKTDSSLRVLISVEALAKGFDVPDVGCVVDCRPLRKSLSTAIQMWGRGLRSSPDTGKKDCLLLDHCIATGQRVLTHRGLVCIEEILLSDKLWDGREFVAHKGVISRGIKPVIQYAGLTATADHPVKTEQGWRTLGQCADEQARIITTGVGRTALRERDGYFSGPSLAGPAGAAIRSCALRVRGLWVSLRNFAHELAGRAHEGLSILQSAGAVSEMALCTSAQHEAALQQPEGSAVQGLRGQRDRVPFRLRDHLRTVGSGQPWSAAESGRDGAGSQGQQRALRAGQHPVVHSQGEHEQHAGQQMDSVDAQVSIAASRGSIRRRIAQGITFLWSFVSGNRGAVGETVTQAEREVWDVLDCGPRNSFTCEGLLVHNSGNITRFAEDYSEIFFGGLDALDMGEKLDKKIRRDDEEKEAKGCPSCGYKPFHKRCMSCGFERQGQSLVESVAGEMQEIMIGKKKLADDQRHLWEQLCTYARAHSAPDKQKWRARYLFRDMTGKMPPDTWSMTDTPNVEVTRNVRNKITSLNMARVKGMAKAAA